MNQVTVEVNSKIQGHAGAFEVLRDSYEAVRPQLRQATNRHFRLLCSFSFLVALSLIDTIDKPRTEISSLGYDT